MDRKIPRISYGPGRNRIARRRKRKLNQPWVVQMSDEVYPVLSRTRTDFRQASHRIVVHVPTVGSIREYCVAKATDPLHARDASAAGRPNVRLCSEKAHAVPHQRVIDSKGGWFDGVCPGCRPNTV